jgi:hypothetical protein
MHTQPKTSSSQRRPEPFSGALGRVYDFLLDIRARFIDAVPVRILKLDSRLYNRLVMAAGRRSRANK